MSGLWAKWVRAYWLRSAEIAACYGYYAAPEQDRCPCGAPFGELHDCTAAVEFGGEGMMGEEGEE